MDDNWVIAYWSRNEKLKGDNKQKIIIIYQNHLYYSLLLMTVSDADFAARCSTGWSDTDTDTGHHLLKT